MTDKGLERVREFHKVFGVSDPDVPTIPTKTDSSEGGDASREYDSILYYARMAMSLSQLLEKASEDVGGSVLLIRLQLIQEELSELALGMLGTDVVEVADALTDLTYVVDGTWLSLGLADYKEACQEEVHRSNLSKLDCEGKPLFGASGRIEKSDKYTPPDLRSILNDAQSV